MDIITRAEAKERGLKHYFTGKPCKHGHVSERTTDNSTCLECDKSRRNAISARYRANNIIDLRKKQNDYAKNNRVKQNKSRSLRKIANPSLLNVDRRRNAEYREKNRDELRIKERKRYRVKKLDAHFEHFMSSIEQEEL